MNMDDELDTTPYVKVQICSYDKRKWESFVITPGRAWIRITFDVPSPNGEVWREYTSSSRKLVEFLANRALKKYERRVRKEEANELIQFNQQVKQLIKDEKRV